MVVAGEGGTGARVCSVRQPPTPHPTLGDLDGRQRVPRACCPRSGGRCGGNCGGPRPPSSVHPHALLRAPRAAVAKLAMWEWASLPWTNRPPPPVPASGAPCSRMIGWQAPARHPILGAPVRCVAVAVQTAVRRSWRRRWVPHCHASPLGNGGINGGCRCPLPPPPPPLSLHPKSPLPPPPRPPTRGCVRLVQ